MASAFSHVLMAYTVGKSFDVKSKLFKFFALGSLCAVFPDFDVLMFYFVPYEHFLGHRGFFHSFFFCFILALLVTSIFYGKLKVLSRGYFTHVLFFFLCGSSHGLLDMLTNGGLGVAIFSPFDNDRYFFSWRPVKVSPIGVADFFSLRGWQIIKSEFIWIGIPCICFLLLVKMWRIRTGNNKIYSIFSGKQ
jgi:inner membrane protein